MACVSTHVRRSIAIPSILKQLPPVRDAIAQKSRVPL